MFPIRDHNPSFRFPFITILIIIFTCCVFLLQLLSPDPEIFVQTYALIPSEINFLYLPSLVPFITSIFLHGGWLHLISNMWFLWIFGDNVEAKLGHLSFLLFYFLTGFFAGFVQYMLEIKSQIPMLGASGAIAGVLGAYLVLFPKNRIDTLILSFGGFLTKVQIPASVMLGYWFITQLFSGVGSISSSIFGGVAWWAHISGFAFGWLLIRYMFKD